MGIQLNVAKYDQLLPWVDANLEGFDSPQEVAQCLIAFLNEPEKAAVLRVPLGNIAPGVRKAIRSGDFMGVTFASLAVCGSSMAVRMTADNQYVLLYDMWLAREIPCSFDLCARMFWDLRQADLIRVRRALHRGVPRHANFDAEECLGNAKSIVVGAQKGSTTMKVTSLSVAVIGFSENPPDKRLVAQ